MYRKALAVLAASLLSAACGYGTPAAPVSQATPSASMPSEGPTSAPSAYPPSTLPAVSPGGQYGPGPLPSVSPVPAMSPGGQYGPGPQASASPVPVQLTAAEVEGLRSALAMERYAYAMYAQVVADLGDVRPFVNVLSSEQTHTARIADLLTKYGEAVTTTTATAPHYANVALACTAAAQNEQGLVSGYERLKATTVRTDILSVYANLQAASRDDHLPAFTRC